jgi:hypothetical protein
MLSKIRSISSPETFAALLVIFDSAWADIAATRKITRDETETARSQLAELVMAQTERTDLADTEKLRHEILQVFWSNRQENA